MKRFFTTCVLTAGLGLFALSSNVWAGEGGKLSGSLSVTPRLVLGERDSSKFEEYRDIPEPISGDIRLLYDQPERYKVELKANEIAEEDQNYSLNVNRYGQYKVRLAFDEIPHRFAYDAKSLFSGVGTGNLTVPDATQKDLQASATAAASLAKLKSKYLPKAATDDLELFRKKGRLDMDVLRMDPFLMRVEFSHEKRDGARPLGASFGFGNAIEIPEPIDYDTTDLRIIGSYSKDNLYLSGSYYVSIFVNNIGYVKWDNPYRFANTTLANSYTHSSESGPSVGLIDLPADNVYHNFTLTGSYSDLPWNSKVTVDGSWGWMSQDDRLVPYTTNTAIRKGAVDGSGGKVPLNAWDRSALPTSNVNADVFTQMYNVALSSEPEHYMHVNAKYRYYQYDNNTDTIEFPGYVRFDAVWEPEEESNLNTGYNKHTVNLSVGLDVLEDTVLTPSYVYERTNRDNREVENQDDHNLGIAVDNHTLKWADFRTSYVKSFRNGDYDFRVPFGDEKEPAQIPLLRKFDEADRERDKVQFITTLSPNDALTVGGSVIFTRDDFTDSAFGLLNDDQQTYSVDVEYALNDRVSVFSFYTFELINSEQRARQWTPKGLGDPYNSEKSINSLSNWSADIQDQNHTVGGGFTVVVIVNKLDWDIVYSYSNLDGNIDFSSAVGKASTDGNAFTPVGFGSIDDSKFHTLNTKFNYHINDSFTATLGYMWEKFSVDDFNNVGYSNALTGLLSMGSLWKDYDAHVVYTKVSYLF